MATVTEITPDAVRSFLEDNGGRYESLVRQVVDALEKLRVEMRNQLVYTVYSRKYKQGGRELKEAWKIVLAVNKARRGFKEPEIDPDTGQPLIDEATGLPKEIEHPPEPYFSIQDLEDIVGVTAVCVYPSDIQRVRDFVMSRTEWIIHKDKRIKQRGYYAHHYTVSVRDPNLTGLRCELQTKTLLHDSWATKTHDLTYKPKGTLDIRMRTQIEVMGDALAAIDRQSDLLKDLIEELWYADAQRKEAARTSLLQELVAPQEPGAQADYQALRGYIRDHIESLRIGDEWKEVGSKIDKLAGAKHTMATCHLYLMLASIRTSDDLDEVALDRISRCLQVAATPTETLDAYLLKGLALFCFGRLGDAVDVTLEALREAEAKLPTYARTARSNAAYYLCEAADSDLGKKWDARRLAAQLIDAVLVEAGGIENLEPHELDTVGLVQIVRGESEEQVQRGLDICRRARDGNTKNPETADVFYKLHERMAWRKILRFR